MARNKAREIYCFNAMTGRTYKYKSMYEASNECSLASHASVIYGLKHDVIVKHSFYFSESTISKRKKLEVYLKCWEYHHRGEHEIWKPYKQLMVSNLGRVKKGEDFLIPRLPPQNRNMEVKIDKTLFNVARMVAELFIVHRELSKDERVIRLGSLINLRYDALKVVSKEEQVKRWKRDGWRSNSKGVGLVDRQGNIIEVYSSIMEASKANHIVHSCASRAVSEGRECIGGRFILLEEEEI